MPEAGEDNLRDLPADMPPRPQAGQIRHREAPEAVSGPSNGKSHSGAFQGLQEQATESG